MHEMRKDDAGNWLATASASPKDWLELPEGDFIKPPGVQAIRIIPDKADRVTGQIGARVGIDHRGSWFMIPFDTIEEARSWAAALAHLCEMIDTGKVGEGAPPRREIKEHTA